MADESEQIGQNEIEELLRAANKGAPAAPAAKPQAVEEMGLGQAEIEALLGGGVATATRSVETSLSEIISSNDIELLLKKAEDAIASIDQPSDNLPPGITPFSLPSFSGAAANSEAATLELVRDVQLDLKIELGRTHMQLEDVLRSAAWRRGGARQARRGSGRCVRQRPTDRPRRSAGAERQFLRSRDRANRRRSRRRGVSASVG